ncbi:unnamed protein product [Acanthoscelides obtectus]|uniref:beta-N-acetylhexosaminidase n=1 Tax=Acanthoscelides obtectus TaxID=200917 RepID=A0A9P0K9D2_ACAOB|nr:unnamed protein product [Acanthoscelides obtectus]CAK1629345.1 Hexosaminidase D [Acanthoscelides obtectus]
MVYKRGPYKKHSNLKLYCFLLVAAVLICTVYFIWKQPADNVIEKSALERGSFMPQEFIPKTEPNNKPHPIVREKIVHLDLKGAPPKTFGHMEFILKLADYKKFREEPSTPQTICPTFSETLHLIETMVKQIIMAHPKSETVHIGADEVYYLGNCNRCKDFMREKNFSKNELYLEHVNSVAKIINKVKPDMRILMWDDELRTFSSTDLRSPHTVLNKQLEPVVWKYSREVYDELGPGLWVDYAGIFDKVWAASAFKGATGSSEIVSQVTHYLQNNRGWLSLIKEHEHRVHFAGIIITGWQRYDHFSVLCELLPVGVPTLAMVLRLVSGIDDSPMTPPLEVARLLNCSQPYGLIGSAFGSPRCSYLGGNLLESALALNQLKQELTSLKEDSRVKGWMNSGYNVKYQFSNVRHMEAIKAVLMRLQAELNDLQVEIGTSLSEIYDEHTVKEWQSTHVQPFAKEVETLLATCDKLLAKDTWPRRPLDRDEL